MPGGFGRNAFVGWAEESTWGTPVAPSVYHELVSESLETVRRREPVPVIRKLDPREGRMYDALFGARGSFRVELNYTKLLRVLEHLFGDASDTITNPDVGVRWVHTFDLKDTVMTGKGLSVHLNTDVDAGSTPQKRLAGFKINQATFSFSPDRNAQLEVEGAAKEVSLVAVSTPTFPSTSLYVAGHQVSVEVDDVARACDTIELVFNNGLDLEKRVMGSKNIDQPVRSGARRSIKGTLVLDAVQADWSKLDAGTLFKLEVLAQGASLGTGFYRFDLIALKCLVDEDPYHVADAGVVKSTVNFTVLEPTSGAMFQAVVHNNESAVG